MEVSYQIENNHLVIAITGQVDSTNAPQMEETIRAIVKDHPRDSIVLDLDKLEYTTSAGLRVAVFTNGFWGADEEKANRLAGALAKAGVTRLHFSADSYHQRYIPFPALARAMRAAR